MGDYYTRSGEPMALNDWVKSFGDSDMKRVALDQVGEAEVSTVWLGLDHSFGSGPPLIFETMIFGGERDGDQWRYPTEDTARAGHERVVAELRDRSA